MNNDKIDILSEPTKKDEIFPLLDSRLISATLLKKYDVKIVDCGKYTQVYYYQNSKVLKAKKDTTDLNLSKIKTDNIFKIENDDNHFDIEELKEKNIEMKNIIRSKLSCQRIAKSNADKWKSFITLTFEKNIIDLKEANKKFKYFIDKVRRVKKDFSYIAIPEFQKRGAIHYHLLTNIDIDDNTLLYSQENNLKYKHIKYWNEGFTSIEVMTGDVKKIVGYISKYMTKDIDNRLFGHRRFFYSQNLKMPKDNFIDLSNDMEYDFYKKRIQNKELIYQNEYINPYDGTKVTFFEFLSNN